MRKSLLFASNYHRHHAASWLLAVVLAGGTYVDSASACSPPERPPTVFDFGASIPEDGATGFALDATLAIGVTVHEQGGEPATPVLTLTDVATGDEVDGEVAVYSWSGTQVRFNPAENLKPDHEYVLRGYSNPEVAALVAITDGGVNSGAPEPDIEVSFTTGTQKLTKLTLSGDVSVVLKEERRPDYSTCEPGLCDCDPSGEVLGTKAIVTLPGASGAQGNVYFARVEVTDAEGQVNTNGATVIDGEPGKTLEVSRVDDETDDYKPCFIVEVRDLSGQVKSTEPVCLDDVVPHTKTLGDAGLPPVEVEGDGGAGTDAGSPERDAAPQITDDTEPPTTTGGDDDTDKGADTRDDVATSDDATTADEETTEGEVDAPVSSNKDDGGCSVTTTRSGTNWSSLGLVGVALGLAASRRRRRAV